VINTAVGKDTHVIENKPDPEVETEAARRLAEPGSTAWIRV